ncbi:MAG: hypothetical protein PUP90_06250 [Nostoc sp. S4]|nr:hypothetical protein [Nostoc sp. S4]
MEIITNQPDLILHGIVGDLILRAIADYIEMRRETIHPNQHFKGKGLSTRSRTWDELRRFESWVKKMSETDESQGIRGNDCHDFGTKNSSTP